MAKLNTRAKLNLTPRKAKLLLVALLLILIASGSFLYMNQRSKDANNADEPPYVEENYEELEPDPTKIEVEIESVPSKDDPKPPEPTNLLRTG